MTPLKLEKVIPKALAIGIVSLLVAWWFHSSGVAQTAKMDTMSPADFVAHKREVYSMSYVILFLGVFVLGSIYILIVEAITIGIRSFWPKPNPFLTDDKRAA